MITRNQDGTYRNLNVLRKVIKILVYGALFIYFGLCAKFMLFPTAAHSEKPATIVQEVPSVLNTAIIIKQGDDPAWGVIKPTKTIKARITWYSVADSCHFPAKGGGCYSANYPHKIQKGDMACPKSYKFGTKVTFEGVTYTCNDRTADWVQKKWAEPTFDIFVPTSKEVKGVKYANVTIN